MQRRAGRGLPEGGRPAALAEAHDAFARGAHIGFDSRIVNFFERAAGVARERNHSHFAFEITDGRKLDPPKIEFGVDKGHTVGVIAVAAAKLADDADFRFSVAFGTAEDEFLLGRKFVFGEDAGAVKTEDDGLGALGKNFAVQIVTDQNNWNFLRDAAAPAHNL